VKRQHLAVLALLATAGAWGATFTLVKNVIQRMSPEAFIFWRFLAAGVILLVFAMIRGRITRALLFPGLILGILVFGAYVSQTRGLLTISPSRSAFLTGLYLVFVPFFQWKTKWTAWVAALLALGGTALIIGKIESRLAIGDALTLFCAILVALHVVFAARWTAKETATPLAGIQVLMVAVLAAPFAFAGPPVQWTTSIVAAILFTAVVTTALAFAALMWAQAHVTATQAAVILAFEPVAAAITSIAFYGEPVTMAFVAGAALILAAMLLSQL
jgi:drug/metabolite transporter (DMT)-like permease